MATLADVLRQTGYSQDGALAAPATDSPMTKALSEHIKTLPQQLATNQAALDSAIGSWNKTDFGTGLPNPNYRPEAIAELTQLMPNIGGLTAWHGTPHKIQGAFDISKVGTGEGAQAYGHGMYFAESPETAKYYQTELAGYKNNSKAELNRANGDFDKAIAETKDRIKRYETSKYDEASQERAKSLLEMNRKKLEELQAMKAGVPEPTGNLYKVDIPDEYIPNMLDWDKPLAQQNKQVLESLKKLNDPYINKAITTQPKLSKDGEYWEYMGNTYGSKSEALEDATPHRIITGYTGLGKTPSEVSQTLNNAGIKGINYLDQNSRIEGKGTRNFVVFEPSTVKILEENGKPLTRKELIEKQVKELKD